MPPKKLRGKGIKESVDTRLNDRPKAITTYLTKYGNENINRIFVCRTPLSGIFSTIGNILTRGEWDVQKAKLGYADVYHLYVLVELDHHTIRIEKNARLEISSKTKLGEEYRVINDIDMSLRMLFDKIEEKVGGEQLYRYDPFSTNCQIFVMQVLDTIGRVDRDITDFVQQDARSLVESEFLKNGAKYATDIVALFDHTINGGKKRRTVR